MDTTGKVCLVKALEQPSPVYVPPWRDPLQGPQRRPLVVIVTAGLSLAVCLALLRMAFIHCPCESSLPTYRLLTDPGASPHFVKIPSGACVNEWQPIDSKEVCEQAARTLDLRATRAATTIFSQRPTGCYLVRNTKADQVALWINIVPGGGSSSMINRAIQGWVPEPICRRTLAPPPDSVLEPSSPTPAPEKSHIFCHYIVRNATTPSCPNGSVPMNASECRTMPYHFGGTLHAPFEESVAQDPPGCFFFRTKYYFNKHPAGAAADGRKLYCKRCKNTPTVYTGDWSSWGDSAETLAASAQANARFRKIFMGKCKDSGMHPIRSTTVCEEASRYLALPDGSASITTIPERPEGCYYFRNYMDGSETLWLSSSPLSHGNGAETSDLETGGLRQPICSKEPLVGTSAEGPGISTSLPPPSSLPYRKIVSGRCKDIGMEPIVGDPAACEDAAKALGLADVEAESVSMPKCPEGCYYFSNRDDLTSTLWINVSPQAKGNGAQSLNGTPHGLRQPLCRR